MQRGSLPSASDAPPPRLSACQHRGRKLLTLTVHPLPQTHTHPCRPYAAEVYAQPGLLSAVGEHLQHHREREDVFMAGAALLGRLLCGDAQRAQRAGRDPELLARLEGVARLLALKQAADGKYLAKLEAQKVGGRVLLLFVLGVAARGCTSVCL